MSTQNQHKSLVLALLISIFLTKNCADSDDQTECLSETKHPYMNFATKTPYYHAHGNIREELSTLQSSGCDVHSVWMMVRHGSRHPTKIDGSFIRHHLPLLRKKLVNAYHHGLGSLCRKDLELLKEWDPDKLSHDRRMQLFETGRVEMKELGARVREALPHFFKEGVLEHNVSIWSTNTDRTKETAKVFLEGFSPSQNLEKNIVVKEHDRIMEFHEICHKYNEKIFNGSHIPAFLKFLKGPELLSVVGSVSERIAVPVERLHVVLMYNACRYYKVMEPLKHSAWCAVFSRKDMEVMEFGEDLFVYHDHGYALDITYEQACPAVQDLLQRFRYQSDSSVFYFTHLETVVKVMTRFGFFNDSKPLTWNAMDSRRRWRTSDFGGFGSNIAFLLTKCRDVGWTVNTYINEKKVHLPRCAYTTGCPWLVFQQLYGQYAVCPFDELCGNKGFGSKVVSEQWKFWRKLNILREL
ncbi:multiple inositol polyphosphate phosphatase 1 isoform X2 [Penaeus vannamei]|uniref:multiple inositol polyphosphate phosphatase 1 isoform X2 n=1 Tax=Penaeus vannamei TaxID=6689 RepID=UPI00387F5C6E